MWSSVSETSWNMHMCHLKGLVYLKKIITFTHPGVVAIYLGLLLFFLKISRISCSKVWPNDPGPCIISFQEINDRVWWKKDRIRLPFNGNTDFDRFSLSARSREERAPLHLRNSKQVHGEDVIRWINVTVRRKLQSLKSEHRRNRQKSSAFRQKDGYLPNQEKSYVAHRGMSWFETKTTGILTPDEVRTRYKNCSLCQSFTHFDWSILGLVCEWFAALRVSWTRSHTDDHGGFSLNNTWNLGLFFSKPCRILK